MKSNIMVDLETMGTRPGSAIVAIGAVSFDEEGVDEVDTFYQNVNLNSCMKNGLTVDAPTIEWWLKQSDAARKILIEDRCDIVDALLAFSQWAMRADFEQMLLWGNGANFDPVLLEYAYKTCEIKWPFKYYNIRCYRTLMALFPVTEECQEGVKHNALSDALNQARAASVALRRVKEMNA